MATKKKMLQAAAGQAGGAGPDITDVFSTYLYEGNGSTQTITNGIDLSGEGGMVWIKGRNAVSNHALVDTERGGANSLASDTTAAERTDGAYGLTFNSDGFDSTGGNLNVSGREQASWTFRKAPKFFDVVTYTGDGVNGRTISHNLGSVPGMILVKRLDSADGWITYHRGMDASSPEDYAMFLNLTNARATETYWNNTAPTSTGFTVSSNVKLNGSSGTYVAYLFAHNDGDGEFGPSGDQDIIKCGSYTGNGSTDGPEIDLGFEPQWLLIKNASGAYGWVLWDSMRGIADGGDAASLYPNVSNAENSFNNAVKLTPTGFKFTGTGAFYNASGDNYIYIAIRRGPLAPPESGTEVFAVENGNGNGSATSPEFVSGFPVDAALIRGLGTANNQLYSRLTANKYLSTDQTDAEITNASAFSMASNEGWHLGSTTWTSWMFRRAPGFFDVVAYTGTGVARTVPHNLGVAPELIIFKARQTALASNDWWVNCAYLSTPSDDALRLNFNTGEITGNGALLWNSTVPTNENFSLGSYNGVNTSGVPFIAYLFATLAGVSKVGSYTGNGTSQTIDCGFTSGARFILIKRTDSTGDWYVWDTERGIVAGNDPHLSLNTTAAEVTSDDSIDPDNSGFIVNQVSATNINVTSASYIFYSVA